MSIISTNADEVTTGLPWRGVHKRVWRGNVLRGQEWGQWGQRSAPAGQLTRGDDGEKRWWWWWGGGSHPLSDWTQWDINIELMGGSVTNGCSVWNSATTHSCVMARGNWEVTRPSPWMQWRITRHTYQYSFVKFGIILFCVAKIALILILKSGFYLKKKTITFKTITTGVNSMWIDWTLRCKNCC